MNMKTVCLNILVMLLSIASLTACHDEPQFADTPTGNFEALWSALDRHYCFFQYKNVDWQEVHDRYAAKISNSMTSEELFRVCSEMLKELKDGHTNLSSSFDTSRYWIWEQYPQNYDERLVEEHYLHFDYRRTSGISYRILDNNYAYMRYPSFSYSIGEGNLDNVLASLANTVCLDFHFGTSSLRLGYRNEFTTVWENNISQRRATHSLVVGIQWKSLRIDTRRAMPERAKIISATY